MSEATEHRPEASPRARAGRLRRLLLVLIACLVPLLAVASPALGSDDGVGYPTYDDDEYDPTETGNPLRIVAYALHPVGVILDTLIFRPAYWIGGHEPIKTLVGRED